jgi:hypothetical protein
VDRLLRLCVAQGRARDAQVNAAATRSNECTARRANLVQCHRAAPSHARAVTTLPMAEEAVGGPQLSPQPVRDEAMPARCAKSALRHACHCAQIVFRRVTDPGYVPALAPPVDLPVNPSSPQCRLYVGSCMLENSSVMPETSVKPFLGRPRAPQTFCMCLLGYLWAVNVQ